MSFSPSFGVITLTPCVFLLNVGTCETLVLIMVPLSLISDKGTMIRTSVSQVPTLSRNTQGVKVITPKEGEKLIECVTIPNEDNEEDE